MCGRFTLVNTPEELAVFFELSDVPDLRPAYNIAPSAVIPIVRERPDSSPQDSIANNAMRSITPAQWGLVPFWAKDPSIGSRMINARCETLADKPAYRSAFRYRRCLLPASGFYEWKREGSRKQPYYFQMRDNRPMALAGLWECWEGADGSALETCVIITTAANRLLAPIHDRMPVMIRPEDFARWLDPIRQKPADLGVLQSLFIPFNDEEMTGWSVNPLVNNPSHDTPECIKPVDDKPLHFDIDQDTFL